MSHGKAERLGPLAGARFPALVPLVTLIVGAVTLDERAGGAEYLAAALVGLGVGGIPVFRARLRGKPETTPGATA
ncbi:MAG: hypothetical protein ABF990_06785 [Acetobacter sp.]|uniref:hypothetical protein n=1 Tax=Acetobacter sp. TaxID=440 RepID=UPI0039E894EB